MLEQEKRVISGRYRLLQRLRRGGMSEVFLAFDEQTQQHIAIKLVNDPDCIKRLQREVRILRNLSHKHILPLLDDGTFDDYHYLVMPYMEHGNLRERLMQGKMTQEEAGGLLVQLASALQCAHEQGILHRDIKPSNILLNDPNGQHIYLADFGLAKPLGEDTGITQTGCLIGTPEYMAPELAEVPESVSSDIYALGILLYQMLTGKLPFTGTTPIATYWKHIQEQPAPPSTLDPAISCSVEQIILRAIDKDPHRRFPSASALAWAYTNALYAPAELRSFAAMQTLPPVSITLYPVKKASAVKPYRVGARVYPPALAPAQDRAVPCSAAATPALKGRRYQTLRVVQKGILSLTALVLLAIPISLGFLLSKNGVQADPALGTNAAFVGKVITTTHTSQPKVAPHLQSSPPITIAATQNGGLSNSPSKQLPDTQNTPPGPHKHGHKHGHGHGHGGGDNGDGNDNGD